MSLVALAFRALHLTSVCSLRGQIGVVPQAPILFDDTIMNNVRYAKLAATDEEVHDACKAASIHEQIMGFTDGTLKWLSTSRQE